jgi:hypothetical protein
LSSCSLRSQPQHQQSLEEVAQGPNYSSSHQSSQHNSRHGRTPGKAKQHSSGGGSRSELMLGGRPTSPSMRRSPVNRLKDRLVYILIIINFKENKLILTTPNKFKSTPN